MWKKGTDKNQEMHLILNKVYLFGVNEVIGNL